MSTPRKGLAILGLASAMIFAGSASAQASGDAGWYVGASLGQAQVDVDCSGTTACDDKDSSWKIFGGYQFNRNFSVELGYTDLGAVTASTPSFVVPPFVIPAANLNVDSTAWELVGIGSLPLGERFSIFGKLGLYYGETDTTVDFGALGAVNESDSTTDFTFGVGMRYDFTRNFGVRAEWQRYMGLKAMDEDTDVDVISLGVVWKF
jgi:OmpA-OmpF porin, OOP family